jgi:hypothetical protein
MPTCRSITVLSAGESRSHRRRKSGMVSGKKSQPTNAAMTVRAI